MFNMRVRRRRAALSTIPVAVAALVIAAAGPAPANHQSVADAARVDPAVAALRILSPHQGAAISGTTVETAVRLIGNIRAASFTARIGGQDVTADFTRDGAREVAHLQSRDLRPGRNHLLVRARAISGVLLSARVRFQVQFRLGKGAGQTLPCGSSANPAAAPYPYVPINTRVPSGGTYAVTIGDPDAGGTTYVANPPAAGGGAVQVLVLDRLCLSAVSNTTYPTGTSAQAGVLANILENGTWMNDCGHNGCLVVLQTLGQPGDTADYGEGFVSLGASTVTNGTGVANVSLLGNVSAAGYSMITTISNDGSVRRPTGTAFERFGCTSDDLGDCLTDAEDTEAAGLAPGSGAISAVLVTDSLHAFVPTYPTWLTYATGDGSSTLNATSNTMTINDTEYTSDDVSAGGFQVVIVNRASPTLEMLSNTTYQATPTELENMKAALSAVDQTELVFVSSIGDVVLSDANCDAYDDLGQALSHLGGSYSQVSALGSGDSTGKVWPCGQAPTSPQANDYALVGTATAQYRVRNYPIQHAPGSAVETSSIVQRATMAGQPLPSVLNGPLQQDPSSGLWSTAAAGLTHVTLALRPIALAKPSAWPVFSAGETVAYQAISKALLGSSQSDDIRSAYTNLVLDQTNTADWSAALTAMSCVNPAGYTCVEWGSVKGQLLNEFLYVGLVAAEANAVDNALLAQDETSTGALATAASLVQGTIDTPPKSADPTVFILELFGLAAGLVPEAGEFLAVPFEAAADGIAFANESSGGSGDGGTTIQTLDLTYANLAAEAGSAYSAAEGGLENLWDLVLTDWNKLQTVGRQLQDSTENPQWAVDTSALSAQAQITGERTFVSALMSSIYTKEYYPSPWTHGLVSDEHVDMASFACGWFSGLGGCEMDKTPAQAWGLYVAGQQPTPAAQWELLRLTTKPNCSQSYPSTTLMSDLFGKTDASSLQLGYYPDQWWLRGPIPTKVFAPNDWQRC